MEQHTREILLRYLDESAGIGRSAAAQLLCAGRAFGALPGVREVCFLMDKEGVLSLFSAAKRMWCAADDESKKQACRVQSTGGPVCVAEEGESCRWGFPLEAPRGMRLIALCTAERDAFSGELLPAAEQLCEMAALRLYDALALHEAEAETGADGLAMLSHELKTPLSVALSSLQLLEYKLETKNARIYQKEYRRFFDYAEQGMYRALRLSEHLADAQYGCGLSGGAPQLVYMDIGAALETLAKEAAPYVQLAGADLSVLAEGTLETMCDPEYLDRILLNLISNAAKYCPAGAGKLALRAWAEEGYICVCMEDNGPGVPKEALPHIFEKFWRGRNGENKGGTGLGLYIAQGAAVAMGGQLLAQHGGKGGMRFTLRLPERLPDGGRLMESRPAAYDTDSRAVLLRTELSDILPGQK